MAGKIFINYRRDDAIAEAGRLHDRLAAAFGRQNLFMDVEHIPAGVDFVTYLESQVAACEVFLAVIGRGWLDLRDEQGLRRIDNPKDFVAIEIAAALGRDIRVIPVLIDGALIPKAEDLPDAIKPLARRHAVDLRNKQFPTDAEVIVQKVREALHRHSIPPRLSVPLGWIGASMMTTLALGYTGAYYAGVPVPWPGSPAAVTGPSVAESAAAEKKRLDDLAAQVVQEREARTKADADAAAKAKADADRKRAEAEAKRVAAEQRQRDADAEDAARAKAEADRIQAAALAKQKAVEEAARRDPLQALTPGTGQAARDRLATGQLCPLCPEMVVVPSGIFMMGSTESDSIPLSGFESPTRKVAFSQPFAVGKFEVTFDEWMACVVSGGCQGKRDPSDRGWGKGRRPVINVSWNDAKEYTAWLSQTTGKEYRLLTEAEWEYSARAGTQTDYHWGDRFDESIANNGNATVLVGQYKANSFGLYDMHGNVWEWVEDCWHAGYKGAPTDGSAWSTACQFPDQRVIRGGGVHSNALSLRSASRGRDIARANRFGALGFRVARTLAPQSDRLETVPSAPAR